jgi:hypothetical protein
MSRVPSPEERPGAANLSVGSERSASELEAELSEDGSLVGLGHRRTGSIGSPSAAPMGSPDGARAPPPLG